MKILFVISDPDIRGGSTKSCITLVNYLLKQNVEPIIICPSVRGAHAYFKSLGIKTYVLKYYFSTRPLLDGFRRVVKFVPKILRREFFNRIAISSLLKIIKIERPDIIHTNTSVIDIGVKCAIKSNLPHIFHIREYGDLDFGMNVKFLSKYFNRPNLYTICITKGIAKYKKMLSSPNNRIIYNGIVSTNSISIKTSKERYFFYAGRIEPTKGIKDLIDTYIEYALKINSPVKLKIAGSIPKSQELFYHSLLDKIEYYGCQDFIEWLGERDDIDSLMRNATATIIPSYNEAFGRVMPEAMSNECLCIGRDTGGTKEQFDNGLIQSGHEIGLRFRNNIELLNHMNEVTTSAPEYWNGYIKRAKKIVECLYSQESYGSKIFSFYLDIISNIKK